MSIGADSAFMKEYRWSGGLLCLLTCLLNFTRLIVGKYDQTVAYRKRMEYSSPNYQIQNLVMQFSRRLSYNMLEP